MAQRQRKARTTTAGGSRGFYWLLGLVALVGVGVLIWTTSRGGEAATAPLEPGSVEEAERMAQLAQPFQKGDPSAPVQLVEFADYQCPACQHYALRVLPQLQPFVDSGQLQVRFYDFPLPGHPNAFIAARSAHCAGAQDRFWDYHDLLFARQSAWSAERSPLDTYVGLAEQLGLDAGAFEQCLRSDRFADVVTANRLVGDRLGVRGTPTVYVNGRSVGDAWNDAGAMRRVIEQAAGGATAR